MQHCDICGIEIETKLLPPLCDRCRPPEPDPDDFFRPLGPEPKPESKQVGSDLDVLIAEELDWTRR
jgi:hypothetical protein